MQISEHLILSHRSLKLASFLQVCFLFLVSNVWFSLLYLPVCLCVLLYYLIGFWFPLVRFSGEGNGTPLQYSCLENPPSQDGGAWWAIVHGVAQIRTRLSDFTFTFHFHVLEKEMATHSSVLAWRIPGMAEPGGLPSMGSHRVGHNWSDLAAAAAAAAAHNYVLFNFKTSLDLI